MKLIRVLCGTILLSSAVSASSLAQEIGYVDLTDGPFHESSRHPRTFTGSCGGGTHSAEPQATVTVLSLDQTILPLGDEVTFELKIQNTGKSSLFVPWTPNLGDLEPLDPKASYKYRVGVVVLNFTDPEHRAFPVSESLYGSADVSGTLRELVPGQWFSVRARGRAEPYPPNWGRGELRGFGWIDAKVSGYFGEGNDSYSPEQGGSLTDVCIPMQSKRANELTVTLERR